MKTGKLITLACLVFGFSCHVAAEDIPILLSTAMLPPFSAAHDDSLKNNMI